MATFSFLFWNLNGKVPAELVARAARECDTNVLVLAESTVPLPDLLFALNATGKPQFKHVFDPVGRITLLVSFPRRSVRLVRDEPGDGLAVRRLTFPGERDLLLALVHLPSKLHQDDPDQLARSIRIARVIEELEANAGHRRTLLVGDLNMNPFDAGTISADGFHAVMTQQLAREEGRIVSGQYRRFFYNPMWGSSVTQRLGRQELTSIARQRSKWYFGMSSIRSCCVQNCSMDLIWRRYGSLTA